MTTTTELTNETKESYIPPRVLVVETKVEKGFAESREPWGDAWDFEW